MVGIDPRGRKRLQRRSGEDLRQGGGLGVAGDDEENMGGVVDQFRRERQPLLIEPLDVDMDDQVIAADPVDVGIGKERGGVAILTHAQENQIEPRQTFGVMGHPGVDYFFILPAGLAVGMCFPFQSKDVLGVDPQGAKQVLIGRLEIRHRVGRPHRPFIAKEEKDISPVESPGVR